MGALTRAGMTEEEESTLLAHDDGGMEKERPLRSRSKSKHQHRCVIHGKTDTVLCREELDRGPIIAAYHGANRLGIPVHRDAEKPLAVTAIHLNARHISIRAIGINRFPAFRRRQSSYFDLQGKEQRFTLRRYERRVVRKRIKKLRLSVYRETMVSNEVMAGHNGVWCMVYGVWC